MEALREKLSRVHDPAFRRKFLESRRDGLGSSDAAAACGLSKWATPLKLYTEKVYPADSTRMTPEQEMGLLLEDVVAAKWERERGKRVTPSERHYRHDHYPFMLAHPDFDIDGGGILETKTARNDEGFGESGTDEVPVDYMLQVQHQLFVTGADEAELGVLIGGSEFRWYRMRASPFIMDRLTQVEGDFWRAVETRTPPPINYAHPEAVALLSLCNRPTAGKTIAGEEHEFQLWAAYCEARKEKGRQERTMEAIKAEVIALMGDASALELPNCKVIRRTVVAERVVERHNKREYTSLYFPNAD